MVTHSIDEAVYMGTRVLVMDAGPRAASLRISKLNEDFPRDRSSAGFVEYRNEIPQPACISAEKQLT